ncbi:hypothetical protein Vadar_019346 [Vaccinium darrowii]|uniref:Uncharacterized protein n=1 Tax=Vaccinium darrowii TaxID=229202 RepID=A0ACB7Z5T9_9ERIC|nr:hypothetical protein Vadar_019346 [Vaccinium darrowii]
MAAHSRRKSGPILRSLSPTPSYSAFASSSSTFSSRSTTTSFFNRPTAPTPVDNVYSNSSPSSPSVRFSLDRPISPSRSISALKTQSGRPMTSSSSAGRNRKKQTCMCSPTTHPGSFRCSLHKNVNNHHSHHNTAPYPSNRLNARRSAMTNSLVRIGTVEGDLVKRALAALIRPSSHQQRRRVGFQPRPSRLSVMSKAEEYL